MGNIVIDEVTGKFIRTLKPGERFVTPCQAGGYKRKLSWTARPKGMTFTTADMAFVEAISSTGEFTAKELGYYMALQTYIKSNKHGKLYRSNRENNPMAFPEICKELGIKNEPSLAKVIGKFMDHGLMTAFYIPTEAYEEEDGSLRILTAYAIPEKIHRKGKTSGTNFIKVFSTNTRELYRKIGPADLGLVYMLLPYVSVHNSILCRNPYEKDEELIEPISQEDIAGITSYSLKTIQNKFSALRYDGKYLFKSSRHRGQNCYRINPLIAYRRSGEPTEQDLQEFTIHKK